MLVYFLGAVFLGTVFLAGYVLGSSNSISKSTFKRLFLTALRRQSSVAKRHSDYYHHKKSFFEQHGRSSEIVFVGDSLTCNADWQELFPAIDATNRGIIGDRTENVLSRIDSILSTDAHTAFVMIGFNDLHQGLDVKTALNNYREIVQQLIRHNMRVIVQSTLLAGKHHVGINPKILSLNSALQELCRRTEGASYIELNDAMAVNGQLNPEFSRDGVHLNADGYAAWRDVISDALYQASESSDGSIEETIG